MTDEGRAGSREYLVGVCADGCRVRVGLVVEVDAQGAGAEPYRDMGSGSDQQAQRQSQFGVGEQHQCFDEPLRIQCLVDGVDEHHQSFSAL